MWRGFKIITLHSNFQAFLQHFTIQKLDIGPFYIEYEKNLTVFDTQTFKLFCNTTQFKNLILAHFVLNMKRIRRSPPFRPMRGLRLQWKWALSLMCEVALISESHWWNETPIIDNCIPWRWGIPILHNYWIPHLFNLFHSGIWMCSIPTPKHLSLLPSASISWLMNMHLQFKLRKNLHLTCSSCCHIG
jgi:hypothetical protein